MRIGFTKMHGAGNDYIYVNTMEHPIANPTECAITWSDRHKGIGADGLVLIGDSQVADFSMRIFNADGSEAKMCGNACRCVGGAQCTGNTQIQNIHALLQIGLECLCEGVGIDCGGLCNLAVAHVCIEFGDGHIVVAVFLILTVKAEGERAEGNTPALQYLRAYITSGIGKYNKVFHIISLFESTMWAIKLILR